jgi:hypothetical protein
MLEQSCLSRPLKKTFCCGDFVCCHKQIARGTLILAEFYLTEMPLWLKYCEPCFISSCCHLAERLCLSVDGEKAALVLCNN